MRIENITQYDQIVCDHSQSTILSSFNATEPMKMNTNTRWPISNWEENILINEINFQKWLSYKINDGIAIFGMLFYFVNESSQNAIAGDREHRVYAVCSEHIVHQ